MTDKIRRVQDYIERLEEYRHMTVVFRGVDHEWRLLPTIVRSFCRRVCLERDGTLDQASTSVRLLEWVRGGMPLEARAIWSRADVNYEKTIFDSFKRQAQAYLARSFVNDWEWLAFAQHYGLPTRLLDWTKNPLAAAYFAVAGSLSDESHDSYVFVLRSDKLESGHLDMIDLANTPTSSPLEWSKDRGVARYIPAILDARMACQQSVFTVADPLEPFLAMAAERLDRIAIDGKSRRFIRHQLHRLGVNRATLFPDVSSLAENLMWVWEDYRVRRHTVGSS